MPTLKDFEDQIAKTTNIADQLTTGAGGGLAFKGKGARLATYFTSSHQAADKAMLQSFFDAMKEEYSAKAAMAGFKAAGLSHRIASGEPLSVKEATLAIRAAKAQHEKDITPSLTYAANVRYLEMHASREADARNWVPDSTFSRVKGAGLRLVTQDQGEFRLHQWNVKNNPDETGKKTVELDILVEKEVAAIKAGRAQAEREGGRVEPMSERLIYLQAKLNLTERMVAEASRNLKPGGPSANVFLGPDMFFGPSDGPGVKDSCARTTGGACTEEEMRQISEGLRRISKRHPGITLMPGTLVWSRPVHPIPIIDGVPRPTDMAYNTAPVFSEGSLVHMTYKMHDGGDANTTAIGLNGLKGSAATPPSRENRFGARLQVFPHDEPTMDALSEDGRAKVQPILATMARQAAPRSRDRDWELGLRPEGAGPLSPYNTIFTVGEKVMALEICRDHSKRHAQEEYKLVKSSTDEVALRAQSQPGPGGGANLHVLLAATSTISPNSTICCTGGTAAYNDVSKGFARSYFVKERTDARNVQVDYAKKLEMTHEKHDRLTQGLPSEAPVVGLSSTSVRKDGPVTLTPGVAPVLPTGSERLPLERPPGSASELSPGERRHDSDLGPPVLVQPDPKLEERLAEMRNVRDVLRTSTSSSSRPRGAQDQSGPEQEIALTEKRGTVRSVLGANKPKPGVSGGGPTISVSGM